MKHIADIQPGGFIVDNEYHLSIGEMINQRDATILALAGDKAIISGVELDGGNHTAGVVTYNGKIYSFIAGATQTQVTTKKIALDRPNANQVDAPAFYEDVIEFGSDGLETFAFSELTRVDNLSKLILAEESEVSDNDLEKIVTLKNLLIRIGSTTVRALLRFATPSEISTGTKTDVAISPKDLKDSEIIYLTGSVSSTGVKLSSYRGTFTSSRIAAGRYLITHNLGTLNYGVTGGGIDEGNKKVGMEVKSSNSCEVRVSDDESLNDADFSFQIFRTG